MAKTRCNLCEITLIEGGRDIHKLSKGYELPFEIEWNGIYCKITNKVVSSICSKCLGKIMNTVKECMRENEEEIEEDVLESIWFE